MRREEIRQAIEYYVEVIAGDHPDDAREGKLIYALDRLALAVHFADYTFDEADYPDALTRDYAALRDLVSPNFPELGLYNVVLDIDENIGEGKTAVGDAIDDICDIARDMEEVLWCWNNTSIDDALWHFKESYDWHWGKHLRDLQLYLYVRRHGG